MVCLHCSWSDATINFEDRSPAAAVDEIFDSHFLSCTWNAGITQKGFLGRESMRNLEQFRVNQLGLDKDCNF